MMYFLAEIVNYAPSLPPVKAEVTTITSLLISLAVSGVLSVAAILLTPKQKAPSSKSDDRPPTLSNRGSFIPLILGRRRTAPVIGWIGRRKRGSSKGATTYREDGWHMICIGPAEKLHQIWVNGKVVFPIKNQVAITSGDTPSGSSITIKKKDVGFPRIYWGEFDQPIDTVPPFEEPVEPEPVPADPLPADEDPIVHGTPDITPWLPPQTEEPVGPNDRVYDPGLAQNIGVFSRWPYVCYMYWNRVKMQGSPVWPTIEYDIEVRLHKTLLGSSSWLDDGTTSGVNPAHALWQVLTDAYPHGCGIPEDQINKTDLESLGEILEEEHLPMNILAADGPEAADMIADMLQDAGFMLYQVSDVLRAAPIREVNVANVPVLTDANLSTSFFELEATHGYRVLDRVIYTFSDLEQNYRDTTIQMDDDSQATANSVVRQESIKLSTVTGYAVAERIAQRRQQEDLTNARQYNLPIARGGRRFYPGMPFIADGKLLRVITFEKSDDSAVVIIKALEDFYSVALPSQTVPAVPLPPIGSGPEIIDADIAVKWIEIPNDLSPSLSIGVLRLRADNAASAANVWGSLDGVGYALLGNQGTPASGGRLMDNFPQSARTILEYGPRFFVQNRDDIETVLDLSSSPNEWRSGLQLAFIGNEIFWLREIVSIGGSQYQMKGVIRARYDTDKEAHSVGDHIYIINRDDLTRINTSSLFLSGDYYIKVQPVTPTEEVDLDDLSGIVGQGEGRHLSALPVENLRVNKDSLNRTTNTYESTDVEMLVEWDYRVVDGLGQAAGESPAGTITPNTSPVPATYHYLLEVLTSAGVLVRTQTPLFTPSYTYTLDQIASDFGSAPTSFLIRVTAYNGGLSSRKARTVTVRKTT